LGISTFCCKTTLNNSTHSIWIFLAYVLIQEAKTEDFCSLFSRRLRFEN
jgi:hypothetical protein